MSDNALEVNNIHAQPIRIYHANLQRVNEGSYLSECPFCPNGVLVVTRHNVTYMLSRRDRCTGCGQAVVYQDDKIGDAEFEPSDSKSV